MTTIKLKRYYPYLTENITLEVSDEIAAINQLPPVQARTITVENLTPILAPKVRTSANGRSRRDFHMSGAAPYGFKLEPTTLQDIRTKMMIPDPATTNIARLMFEMYAEPSTSFGDIARYFAENNILIYDKELKRGFISQLLRNPIYAQAGLELYEFFKGQGAVVVNDAAEFEQFVYGEMVKKLSEFQTLTAKATTVNPKLTALNVELAQVEDEIEKLLNTLTEANAVLLSYANGRIEKLDANRQRLIKEIAALNAETIISVV